MSQLPTAPSPDVQKLVDEGYEIVLVPGYLVVKSVPYLNISKEVLYGGLICKLSGAERVQPDDHVAYFSGQPPCDLEGRALKHIIGTDRVQLASNVWATHTFSSKPPAGNYPDQYTKVRTYVAILSKYAHAIDPNATALTFALPESAEESCVFQYRDTASTRANIMAVSEKMEQAQLAIVGTGGTGAYILDLLAKCPVRNIHLFDADRFASHNAFRAPGAASLETLRTLPSKVAYLAAAYSNMHRGIVAHETNITHDNVEVLNGMTFVFLSLDAGPDKPVIVKHLEAANIPFVDVGMGVRIVNGALHGQLRVTTSTAGHREHVWDRRRIPFEGDGNNEYSRNIQVADLNALNAALAVIQWKKICGFYSDVGGTVFTAYTTFDNAITNEPD